MLPKRASLSMASSSADARRRRWGLAGGGASKYAIPHRPPPSLGSSSRRSSSILFGGPKARYDVATVAAEAMVAKAKEEELWRSKRSYMLRQTFAWTLMGGLMVFSCVLDTLFVCCARDTAEYKGKYMPDRLRTVFGFDKRSKKKSEASAGEAGGDEGAADPGDV